MKKYGLISVCACLLFAFPATTNAQETTEYFPQGTIWEEECYVKGYDGSVHSDYRQYTVSGDTVISDVTYKKVIAMRRMGIGMEDFPYWDSEEDWTWEYAYAFAIREKDNKVYYYSDEYQRECLRYDFDWEAGKQIPDGYDWKNDAYSYFTIDDIKQMELLDGNVYEYIDDGGDNSYNVPKVYQIRGIGFVTLWKGLFEYDFWIPFSFAAAYYHVMNFTRNGELIYEWDRSEVTGIENAVTDRQTSSDDSVYSVTGVRMNTSGLQPLPRGVYIRSGKKFLVK